MLASFINDLGSLHSLRLDVVEYPYPPPFDVFHFFDVLHSFPLRNLMIRLPFDGPADPSQLSRFINNHRHTLQHLVLRPYCHSLGQRLMANERVVQMLSHLLPSNLLSLELDINCLRAVSIIHCIQPFSNTLTSLALTGTTYLEYDKIEVIVSAFSHRPAGDRLTVLMFGLKHFDEVFFDPLSRALPSLEKLCITLEGKVRSAVPSIYKIYQYLIL